MCTAAHLHSSPLAADQQKEHVHFITCVIVCVHVHQGATAQHTHNKITLQSDKLSKAAKGSFFCQFDAFAIIQTLHVYSSTYWSPVINVA